MIKKGDFGVFNMRMKGFTYAGIYVIRSLRRTSKKGVYLAEIVNDYGELDIVPASFLDKFDSSIF